MALTAYTSVLYQSAAGRSGSDNILFSGNDFLFGKVMQEPELCKELLHRILPDLEIDHIEYPE